MENLKNAISAAQLGWQNFESHIIPKSPDVRLGSEGNDFLVAQKPSLSSLEDHYLTCPWHGCKYDLKTGKAVNGSDKSLETFPVEIEDDGLIKVEIAY